MFEISLSQERFMLRHRVCLASSEVKTSDIGSALSHNSGAANTIVVSYSNVSENEHY